MPLFTTNTEQLGGSNASFTGLDGEKMFNTVRIGEIYEFGDTGSAFDYAIEWDGDLDDNIIICDSTVASLQTEYSKEYSSGAVPLTSFPYGDITLTTETIYVDAIRLVFGVEYDDYTYLLDDMGVEMWVTESIEEIIALSVVGEATDSYEWTDGTSTFRLNVRSSSLFLDKKLTDLGWDGVEDTDWENIWEKT